jgi:hypothetical protein
MTIHTENCLILQLARSTLCISLFNVVLISERFLLCSPVLFLCGTIWSFRASISYSYIGVTYKVSQSRASGHNTPTPKNTICHQNYINKVNHSIHVCGSTQVKLETLHPVQRFLFLDVWCYTLNLTQIFCLKYTVRRTCLFKLPEEVKQNDIVYTNVCKVDTFVKKHGSMLVLKMCNNSNKTAFRLWNTAI